MKKKKTAGFSQTSTAGLSNFFGQSFATVNVEWLADHTRKNHSYIVSNSLNNCVILLHLYIFTYLYIHNLQSGLG